MEGGGIIGGREVSLCWALSCFCDGQAVLAVEWGVPRVRDKPHELPHEFSP